MSTHSDLPLQEIHDFMIRVALEAASRITSAKPSTSTSGSKKNSVDLVTATDRAVEQLISTSLSTAYPSFSFMGEETYQPGDVLTASPTFILDPIDGTTNFVHRNPYVAISLGLAVDKKPTVGVVYNPFTGALYSGIKGHGSYFTQLDPSSPSLSSSSSRQKLPLTPLTPLTPLSTCLIAIEWGSDRSGPDFLVKTRTFANLAAASGGMVHGLRSLGSAALNLCAVAAGSLDIYWEAGCWAWDVCAGWVVLSEAGGLMADANPGNWAPRVEERRYMAVRGGEGQREVVEAFWGLVEGRFEVGV